MFETTIILFTLVMVILMTMTLIAGFVTLRGRANGVQVVALLILATTIICCWWFLLSNITMAIKG